MNVTNIPPGHVTTPTGLPSWYGQRAAREERSIFSPTGDVELRVGRTFPTSFPTLAAAAQRARAASARDGGAVIVFHDTSTAAGTGAWWLARSYNVERGPGGLVLGRTHLDGSEHLTHWHPEAQVVVDGRRMLGSPLH